jgi:hypothetical protein
MREEAQDSRGVVFVFHYNSRSGPPHAISAIDAASAWKLAAGLALGPSVIQGMLIGISRRVGLGRALDPLTATSYQSNA